MNHYQCQSCDFVFSEEAGQEQWSGDFFSDPCSRPTRDMDSGEWDHEDGVACPHCGSDYLEELGHDVRECDDCRKAVALPDGDLCGPCKRKVDREETAAIVNVYERAEIDRMAERWRNRRGYKWSLVWSCIVDNQCDHKHKMGSELLDSRAMRTEAVY